MIGYKLAARYRLVRLIGRGGMGEVYLAKHVHTGEQVALKVLLAQAGATPQAIERFRREMRAPGRIKSEHVVRVTDADAATELNGTPFLVMELLDGCDLDKLLQERGPYTAEETVWIFGQVARGLDKAHALGIVHRDLKPENMFLHLKEEAGLIVKILDFGIARLVEPQNLSVEAAKLTNTGTIVGTPMYLSPEQAKGETEQIGPASDIWSLGMIAFELLTGKPYWKAETFASLVGKIMFAPMPPAKEQAPGLPSAFSEWFARSCDRDPAKRWSSASKQAEGLATALKVSPNQLRVLEAPTSLQNTVHRLRSDAVSHSDTEAEEPDDVDARSHAQEPHPKLPSAATKLTPARETVQRRHYDRPRRLVALVAVGVPIFGAVLVIGYGFLHDPKTPLQPQPMALTPAPPVPKVASPDLGTTPLTAGNEPKRRSAVSAARPSATRPSITQPRPTTTVLEATGAPSKQSPKNKATGTASGYDPDGR